MDRLDRQRGGALTFDNVVRRFGARVAVDGLTLSLASGEVLCLLGSSGCGKTTTLRMAAGLERLDGGEIRIDGKCVESASVHMPPEQRGVGLMFQDFALFPHLRVIDNVAFGLRRLGAEARLKRADEMLERVGMSRYRASFPHQLSGGEQQRVALARALAPNPRILLMDEPFSGLDPLLRDQVRRETFDLLRGLGTTVLLVTHDPREAMEVADRIALMRKGRLVQLGTPAEIFANPVDRDVASFFGDMNIIHAVTNEQGAPTALGLVPSGSFSHGTLVEVLVRPHSIRISGVGEDGIRARVLASRQIGCETVIDLEVGLEGLPPGAPPMPVLRMRAPQGAQLPPGAEIRVAIDTERTLVFPCRDPACHIHAQTPPHARSAPAALHQP